MNKQIEELKKQLAEKQNLYLRALADYQNLEKRVNQQNEQVQQKQLLLFLKKLIDLKEDMDKAVLFHQDNGLKLILNKLNHLLVEYKVTEINPLNQDFNPETMECVQIEKGQTDNKVIKVLGKGYFYSNELLQPSKVIVSQLEVHPKIKQGKTN